MILHSLQELLERFSACDVRRRYYLWVNSLSVFVCVILVHNKASPYVLSYNGIIPYLMTSGPDHFGTYWDHFGIDPIFFSHCARRR